MAYTKEQKKIYDAEYQKANKEKRKKYLEENKEKIAQKKREYRLANKQKLLDAQKKWRGENKEKLRQYHKEKYEQDNLYRLKVNIKNLIGNSFRKEELKKISKTEAILGCTFEYLKQHLESKFELWMNWENRGLYNGTEQYGWDIDHIIPLASANTPEDIIRLNHYTNLQPLCSKVNRDIKYTSI